MDGYSLPGGQRTSMQPVAGTGSSRDFRHEHWGLKIGKRALEVVASSRELSDAFRAVVGPRLGFAMLRRQPR